MEDTNKASFSREIKLELRIAELEAELAEREAEVTRLTKLMGLIDQRCCEEQAKWKDEAQWAANKVLDSFGWIENREISGNDAQRAQHILKGKLWNSSQPKRSETT